MIVDWNRLDFEFIKDQASWVCACSEQTTGPRTFYCESNNILALEEFKRLLNDRITLEQWASWLSDLVNRFIGTFYLLINPITGKVNDPRELVSVAQNLLLKWSFYCSLIIRDLTIRNAPSFGNLYYLQYHLIF